MSVISHELRWAARSSLCFRTSCLCGWADQHTHVQEADARTAYNGHIPVQVRLPGTKPGHVHAFRDLDGVLRVGCDADLCDKCRTPARVVAELVARLLDEQRRYMTVASPVAVAHVGAIETLREIASFRLVLGGGIAYTLAVSPAGQVPPACEVHGDRMEPEGHSYICRRCVAEARALDPSAYPSV